MEMKIKFRGKISRKVFLSLIGLIGMTLLMTACAGPQVAIVRPTCQEALGERYQDLTDYEIARLLDDNLIEDCPSCLESCWIPLMEKALDDNRAIPHRHLLKAVKVFNQNQYDRYFHIALYRYFRDLSQGRGQYRAVDRELLRSYCSKLVQDSFTQQDKKLSQTMELCRRIDPELYRKMFQ
jgi:hypothetical protein